MLVLGPDDLMLASRGPIRDRADWIYETKLDGYRALARKDRGVVRFMSRNGKDATAWWPDLSQALSRLRGDFVIDCEICVLDARGIPDFEAMQKAVKAKRAAGFSLHAFDLLFAGGKDLRGMPLLKRKARLETLVRGKAPTVVYVDHIEEEGKAAYGLAVKLGFEGIMSKRADSLYIAGRGVDWIKTKPAGVHDGWKRPLYRATTARASP
jgi:bifunctional non-homologous end joining protein LigD